MGRLISFYKLLKIKKTNKTKDKNFMRKRRLKLWQESQKRTQRQKS